TMASIEAALAAEGADVGVPAGAEPEPSHVAATAPAEPEVAADGTLSVRAKASRRCQVRIDGQRLGRAPLNATVPAGQYRLAVSCKGGRRTVRDIEVRAGEQAAFVMEGRKLKSDGKARLVRRARKGRGATL
ncbi:MAG: PEGA domain-containing protein, partial [Deltaproteobacteria bacterium]|nr:PEGA domain-containing protein [Deltaproteobacteria bacterium]